MQVLNELEKIDDDCDRHGIQFVKIDDEKAAKDFGINSLPAIVYFEKQIPNLYDGGQVGGTIGETDMNNRKENWMYDQRLNKIKLDDRRRRGERG